MITRLTAANFTTVPWKNGGGVSTTIAGERLSGFAAGDWAGVIWQLGRTAIVTPAPFSDLSGFERLQTVVAGSGLFLDSEEGVIDLSVPTTVARYDGGLSITSRLTQGPVEVVNLIARRDRALIDMAVLDAGAARVVPDGITIVLAFGGSVEVKVAGVLQGLADGEALRIAGEVELSIMAGKAVVAMVRAL